MNQLPATSAADADLAPMWWRALTRSAWKRHLKRAAWAACAVVVVGAGVSVYLSKVGLKSCVTSADGDRTECRQRFFYPFTVQQRSDVVTVNGKVTERREWHPTGAVWIEGKYDGVTGKRNGLWRELYADGALRFEGYYQDDEIAGTETWYYPTGTKEWEIGRRDGVRDGEERWYHENGELRRLGTYKAGEREGTFTVFNEDGHVAFTGEYEHGVNVSGRTVD